MIKKTLLKIFIIAIIILFCLSCFHTTNEYNVPIEYCNVLGNIRFDFFDGSKIIDKKITNNNIRLCLSDNSTLDFYVKVKDEDLFEIMVFRDNILIFINRFVKQETLYEVKDTFEFTIHSLDKQCLSSIYFNKEDIL